MRKLFLFISVLFLAVTAQATIPSTDFAGGYAFKAADATLDAGIVTEDHYGAERVYFRYTGSTPTFAAATWQVQATRDCFVEITVHQADNSWNTSNADIFKNGNHNFDVELYDANEVRLDTIAERPYEYGHDGVSGYPTVRLGTMHIPAAGTYTVKLKNLRDWAKGGIDSVTFAYAGGERINIPDTLKPIDAICSARARNTVDTLFFAPAGSEGDAADANYTVAGSQYGKWNIKVTKAGKYKFTANTYCKQGHNYRFILLNQAENDTILKEQEVAGNGHDYHNEKADWKVSTSTVDLEKDKNYVLMMQARAYGRVMWVAANYEGGDTIDIPASLDSKDAILSDNGTRTDGVISVSSWSSGFVKWNTHVSETSEKYYDVKLNVLSASGNGHTFTVAFYEGENVTPSSSATESSWSDASGMINIGRVLLKGNTKYVVKVTNGTSGSTARVTGASISYAGGEKIEIPGMLYGTDALLNNRKMYRTNEGIIKYNDNGTPTNEYAYWRIHATGAYSGKVILDIPQENSSGHEFRVELLSALDGEASSSAYESELAPEHSHSDKGLVELEQTFIIPAEGDYYIKVINKTLWSSALLRGISIAPAVIISEEAADLDDITDAAVVNAQLTRSFVGGMYNTICLPFAVNASEMARVFPGAKLKQLESSSIEGENDFVLNLNFNDAATIAAGVPYLIWPAADVTNPKFIGVTIDKTLHPTETARANFIGNFVVGSVPEGEDNLFLGADNTLYFPVGNAERIYGMRAYFQVHAPAGVSIRRARINDGKGQSTDIDLIGEQEQQNIIKAQKVLQNGQIFIIRDGVKYNALGIRIE